MHNNSPPDLLPFQDVHANEQEPHSFRLDNLNVEDIFSVPLQMIWGTGSFFEETWRVLAHDRATMPLEFAHKDLLCW